MLKTEEVIALEERWNELRNRRLFKKLVVFFVILLLILSAVLVYLVLNLNSKKELNVAPKEPVAPAVNVANDTNITATNPITNNSEPQSKQEININIKVDTPTVPAEPAKVETSSNTSNVTIPNASVQEEQNKTVEKQPIPVPKENKIIIETNTIQNIDTLIDKFENTNNIMFANMIADEYFEKKDYKKSLEWALKANEKDPNSETSWIMFAKSQVKLGNKEDAIRALEGFMSYSKNATAVSSLLRRIKNGEYK